MAGNSKDSKILAYKDMINQLNKTISTQTELIQSLQKTLEALPLHRDKGKVPCSIFPTGVQRISGDGWIPGL